ncbi:hypothetical protein [Parasitella parasitica]|uniref:Uncharacterized protein n=1 Tax=Parasitella parasitica TaxID=35722 RepID=A0A0B7NCZ7_9FUNG|nr:hypothetical protein [Parasitella parasitica]
MADHQEMLDDLIYFARTGELEEIKQIKASAKDFVEKDESGKTALHMASANNHVGIVEYIVERLHELDENTIIRSIDTQNAEGNTPLHWAALNGHLDVVKILVKEGGDCKIKNSMGVSPIYEAQQRNQEEIAKFFLETMIEDDEEPVNEEEQIVEKGVSSTLE